MKMKWTKATLEKLPPYIAGAASSNHEVADPVGAGLKLQHGTTGRKFFWFRATPRAMKNSNSRQRVRPHHLEF